MFPFIVNLGEFPNKLSVTIDHTSDPSCNCKKSRTSRELIVLIITQHMSPGLHITTLRLSERFKNTNGRNGVRKTQYNENCYILFMLGNSVDTSTGNITSTGTETGGTIAF